MKPEQEAGELSPVPIPLTSSLPPLSTLPLEGEASSSALRRGGPSQSICIVLRGPKLIAPFYYLSFSLQMDKKNVQWSWWERGKEKDNTIIHEGKAHSLLHSFLHCASNQLSRSKWHHCHHLGPGFHFSCIIMSSLLRGLL